MPALTIQAAHDDGEFYLYFDLDILDQLWRAIGQAWQDYDYDHDNGHNPHNADIDMSSGKSPHQPVIIQCAESH